MATKANPPAGSGKVDPGKIISGDDKDLAAALADTEGASGKITFQQPGEGEGEGEGGEGDEKKVVIKPKAKSAKKKKAAQSTESDEGEGSGSAIVDTYLQLHGQSGEGEGEEGEGEGEGGEGEGEGEGGEGEGEETGEIEGFEEVDTNIPVGPQIKEKFKRFKANEKALKGAHAASQAIITKNAAELKKAKADLLAAQQAASQGSGEVEESEAYKKLLKRAEGSEELVERIRLEESPRFQDQYDNKIAKSVKSAAPFVKAIPEGGARDTAVAVLDAAANIPAGEDNDPAFYEAITKITSTEGMPEHVKSPLFGKLVELRGHINSRHEALTAWKDKSKEFGDLDLQGIRQRTADAATVSKRIRAQYEEQNADRLGIYHGEQAETFGYDASVKPKLEILEKEIAKSVEVGAPTPNLIALAQYGAEFEFQMSMGQRLGGLLQEQQKKIAAMQERLKKFGDGGTGDGKAGKGKKTGEKGTKTGEVDPADYEGGSGILQTAKELQEAGT